MIWFWCAADNDKYFKRLINIFFTKIEFSHPAGSFGKAPKAQKKMRSIFLLRAFAPLWQIIFRSEAEKKNLLPFVKSLFFY
jgi:hypothetical protein